MSSKMHSRWLSILLAAALCVTGPLSALEVEAAVPAAVADPMKEVLSE